MHLSLERRKNINSVAPLTMIASLYLQNLVALYVLLLDCSIVSFVWTELITVLAWTFCKVRGMKLNSCGILYTDHLVVTGK